MDGRVDLCGAVLDGGVDVCGVVPDDGGVDVCGAVLGDGVEVEGRAASGVAGDCSGGAGWLYGCEPAPFGEVGGAPLEVCAWATATAATAAAASVHADILA